jgi:sirohydrochlorin ferrochelatase
METPSGALVLVDHGSRQPAANELIEAVAERVRVRRPGVLVLHAHMEIASPSIAEAIGACARAGARHVHVQPYFLAPGHHTRSTIPKLVAEAAADHPQLSIEIGEPFGLDEKLIDILLERTGHL